MIQHIVLFTFVAGVTWDDPRAQAAERLSAGHPGQIPEILEWVQGRNITQRDIACDFAIVALFADKDALQRYQVHPDHLDGVAAWQQISTWVTADLAVAAPDSAMKGRTRPARSASPAAG